MAVRALWGNDGTISGKKSLTFYSHCFTIYLVIQSIWRMPMNEKYERQMKKGVLMENLEMSTVGRGIWQEI